MGHFREGNCRDQGPGVVQGEGMFNDRLRKVVFWEW